VSQRIIFYFLALFIILKRIKRCCCDCRVGLIPGGHMSFYFTTHKPTQPASGLSPVIPFSRTVPLRLFEKVLFVFLLLSPIQISLIFHFLSSAFPHLVSAQMKFLSKTIQTACCCPLLSDLSTSHLLCTNKTLW